MSELRSKHVFGSREGIDAAKAGGAVNKYDILFLTNGEIGWLDKNNETKFNTPRTQTDIEVNGVTGLGVANGSVIEASATIDDIVKMLVQKPIPASYTEPTVSLANNGDQSPGNVEAGTFVSPKLKATFTQNDVGDLSAIST